jgi:hypothetical protein
MKRAHYEQLLQLTTATWDGHLISKGARDDLVKLGYAECTGGWTIATVAGVRLLLDRNLLKAARDHAPH